MTPIPNRKEITSEEVRPPRERLEAEVGGAGAGRRSWPTGGEPEADEVETGSMESFPASDPPAWMPPTVRMGPPRRG